MPEGVTFVSASGGGIYQDGKVVWNLGKVWPGQQGSLKIVVQVNSDVIAGDQLVNSVSISTSTDEPNKGNNFYSVIVWVSFIPSPTPTLSPSPTPSLTPTPSPGIPGPTEEVGVGGPPAPPGPSVCNDSPPGGAPKLLSAVSGVNSVTLTWSKAPNPVSYYLVAYGLSSGNYIYGNPDVGGPETTSYTVGNLFGGVKYYFVVRAGNGCAPGPFSNELSATPFGGPMVELGIGFFPGILGVKAAEGEVGEALAAEAAEFGEVAGVEEQPKPTCPWWLILSLGEAGLLGFYYWLIGKKRRRRFWWFVPLSTAALAFLGDQYLAHRYFSPSRFCSMMWFWSILGAVGPTAFYLYFRKK